MPPFYPIFSLNSLGNKIILNEPIYIELNYEGDQNVDNLVYTGTILYKNLVKKAMKFDYNTLRFKV
jgi:hypothetical protein